jgi:hypothetical protein
MEFEFWLYSKICWAGSRLIKIWQEYRVLSTKTDWQIWQYYVSRLIPLIMRNASDKICNEIKTYTLCSKLISWKSCRLWTSVEKSGTARLATDDNIIQHMRFTRWINKAINTHSEYVILIVLLRQLWLRQRTSILRIYVQCLSCLKWSVGKEGIADIKEH